MTGVQTCALPISRSCGPTQMSLSILQIAEFHNPANAVAQRRHVVGNVAEADKARYAQRVAGHDGHFLLFDQALREALVKAFPKLKKVQLADYKVRVLAGQDGTSAQTRVVIRSTDGARSWGTVGVSANLVEASLRAIVDGYAYALS